MSPYETIISTAHNKPLIEDAKLNGWKYPRNITSKQRTCPECGRKHTDIRLKENFCELVWKPSLCVNCGCSDMQNKVNARIERVQARHIEKANLPLRAKDADFASLRKSTRDKLLSCNLQNGLWIRGDYQIGKTWAVVAFLKHLAVNHSVRFVYFPSFFQSDINETLQLFEELKSFGGVLAVDDVTEKTPDYWKSRLEDLVISRYDSMLPTIYTTNILLDNLITELGERIYFRISRSKAIFEFDKRYQPEDM